MQAKSRLSGINPFVRRLTEEVEHPSGNHVPVKLCWKTEALLMEPL